MALIFRGGTELTKGVLAEETPPAKARLGVLVFRENQSRTLQLQVNALKSYSHFAEANQETCNHKL